MWEMTRIWPIFCQFGVGAILMLVGIVAGIRGKYLSFGRHEDRLLITVLIGGYLLLLAVYVALTILAPLT